LRISESRFIKAVSTYIVDIWARGAKLDFVINRTDISAFRAQLVVPEQRQLFDYWLKQANDRSMPARNDIHPTHVPRLLPGISLVDVATEVSHSTVRLAGTKLREIYDREITGLKIEDLDWNEKRDYWLASYNRTIYEAVPTQGILRAPRHAKEHMVQYWLRLPLFTQDAARVSMVLCYDYFMPASERLEEQMRLVAGG
jgi:PAS domain